MKSSLIPVILATSAIAACDGSSTNEPATDDAVGLPNPAATFCIEQGGEYNIDSGQCRLADGTEVDAWEYFREHNDEAS